MWYHSSNITATGSSLGLPLYRYPSSLHSLLVELFLSIFNLNRNDHHVHATHHHWLPVVPNSYPIPSVFSSSNSISSSSLSSVNYDFPFSFNEFLQNISSNISNSTINATRCHSSLLNTSWSREANGRVDYGLCPDTFISFALCLVFLLAYVTTIVMSGVGVIWKRKSGHVSARNPIYMFFTLIAGFVFIAGMLLRIIIGRKIYPCGLLTICFFTFPPAVSLPTIFRLMRGFFMYKINLLKTKLFESPNTNGNATASRRMSASREEFNKQFELAQQQSGFNNSSVHHNSTIPSAMFGNEDSTQRVATALGGTTHSSMGHEHDEISNVVDITLPTDIMMFTSNVNDKAPTSEGASSSDHHEPTLTDSSTRSDNSTKEGKKRHSVAHRSVASSSSSSHPILNPHLSLNSSNTTGGNGAMVGFILNPTTTTTTSSSMMMMGIMNNGDYDEYDTEMIMEDSESAVDVSTWNMSDYKDMSEMRSELRKLKIFNFLVSYKFICVVYALAFLFGIVLWLVAGGIEEALYNSSTDPNKKRIFLLDGGILVFDRGCGMSTNTILIIGLESIAYIIVEAVFLVITFFVDRDTWGIKKETIALIAIQVTSAVLFIILGTLDVIQTLIDYYVPYGFVLWGYMFLEIIVAVTLPVLYAIRRDYKESRRLLDSKESGLEKVLKNKKTFAVMLDFARRSFAPESVQCWRDIQRFKKTKRSNRKKAAMHILNAYLTLGAPLELNMSRIEEKRKELLCIIEKEEKISPNLFVMIQDHCLNDMADLFERLRNSNKEIAEIVKKHSLSRTQVNPQQ
ncbi:hypothetical protein C9374_011232 [Naegleria lovaniensis]|uniref:RGS domain-containing protein n=1 Tax=Naegleria lovaniensis TaxID=51637 RepID=A0AA88H3Q1_NAELO|nr:uncharacterized protein C9374_011232 [Naegleria lovaniensis]KAG2392507.1 hypothetical protein C9374_011232 [Naegleria lovaniensis]